MGVSTKNCLRHDFTGSVKGNNGIAETGGCCVILEYSYILAETIKWFVHVHSYVCGWNYLIYIATESYIHT